jgi:hypothetical protein
MNATNLLFIAAPVRTVPVRGAHRLLPVKQVFRVGRNDAPDAVALTIGHLESR